MKKRNFTGEDLAVAEQSMKTAYNFYLEKKQRYDGSIAMGHDGYARRNHLQPMQEALKAYEAAKTYYNDILQAIEQANNIEYKSVQQGYVSDALIADAQGETKQTDYTTWVYIAIAVLVIAFFWKS